MVHQVGLQAPVEPHQAREAQGVARLAEHVAREADGEDPHACLHERAGRGARVGRDPHLAAARAQRARQVQAVGQEVPAVGDEEQDLQGDAGG